MGYQPDESKLHYRRTNGAIAITTRNLFWGFYVRVLDGDVIWESWLWGAYRRRKRVVPRLPDVTTHPPLRHPPALVEKTLSKGDRAAFAALGGVLDEPSRRTITCVDGLTMEFDGNKLLRVVSKTGEVLFEHDSYTQAGVTRLSEAWR